MITRRQLGTLLGGGALLSSVAHSKGAKINSTFRGVTVGAQSYSFRDRPLDACIAAMKEIGLGECELFQGHIEPKDKTALAAWRKNPPLDEIRGVRKKFDEAGINLYALNYSMRADWSDEELAKGFEIAKALGVKYITASSNVSGAKRIDKFAQAAKIIVAMHNHSNLRPNEFARAEDFAEAMNGTKNIAINFDIGHFTAAGFDPVSFIEQHHQHIITLHIKDRLKNQGKNVPFGEGDTKIKEVLHLVRDKKYKIPANIEFEYAGDPMVEVKKCFAYCKTALES
ncbi:MAG: sugar phosphate isomerase/epimerase [Bryobacteraceae bacterium]